MKIFCDHCKSIATWCYTPDDNSYCCDKHVPRGCSCNIKHSDELDDNGNLIPIEDEDGNYVQETDELGRLLPCCEYDFNPHGFDEFNEDDYDRFLREHPDLENI